MVLSVNPSQHLHRIRINSDNQAFQKINPIIQNNCNSGPYLPGAFYAIIKAALYGFGNVEAPRRGGWEKDSTFKTECSGEFFTGERAAAQAVMARGPSERLIGNPVKARSDPVTVRASSPPDMSLRSNGPRARHMPVRVPETVGRRRRMMTLSQETCSPRTVIVILAADEKRLW